jgi:hypothetical protein
MISRASAGNEGSAVSPQAKKRCRNAVARALLKADDFARKGAPTGYQASLP